MASLPLPSESDRHDESSDSRAYRTLVRGLARALAQDGVDWPWSLAEFSSERRAEAVAELRRLGRTPAELERDLEGLRERSGLIHGAAELLDLAERCEIAREGFRLVREAARQARAEADERERRAREVYQVLQRRLAEAKAAREALEESLPGSALADWREAEELLQRCRAATREARGEGRNVERLEAAVQQAELRYEAARRGVRESYGLPGDSSERSRGAPHPPVEGV